MKFGCYGEDDYELGKFEKANLRAFIEFRIFNNLKYGDRQRIIDAVWEAGDEKDVHEMVESWGFTMDELVEYRLERHQTKINVLYKWCYIEFY
ncbi:MAG: hypothetical protein MI743_19255 [Sneathiellales bacterium]|nr:hypothetical protein [Sneathiellales bacterium]